MQQPILIAVRVYNTCRREKGFQESGPNVRGSSEYDGCRGRERRWAGQSGWGRQGRLETDGGSDVSCS